MVQHPNAFTAPSTTSRRSNTRPATITSILKRIRPKPKRLKHRPPQTQADSIPACACAIQPRASASGYRSSSRPRSPSLSRRSSPRPHRRKQTNLSNAALAFRRLPPTISLLGFGTASHQLDAQDWLHHTDIPIENSVAIVHWRERYNGKMFLSQLKIEGIRGLENLVASFTPNLNVIVGPNNCGKSSLIDAIRLALSPRDSVHPDG